MTDDALKARLKEPEPCADQPEARQLHDGVWPQMATVGGNEEPHADDQDGDRFAIEAATEVPDGEAASATATPAARRPARNLRHAPELSRPADDKLPKVPLSEIASATRINPSASRVAFRSRRHLRRLPVGSGSGASASRSLSRGSSPAHRRSRPPRSLRSATSVASGALPRGPPCAATHGSRVHVAVHACGHIKGCAASAP
jgi:hypothetical protein